VNTKMAAWLAALVLVIRTSAFAPASPAITESPCRSGNDTATLALSVVKNVLAASDSAEQLEPQDINASIVTDSVTCQAIVDGYNAARSGADSILRVSSGYVVRAVRPAPDTTFALYLPATSGSSPRSEELAHFDKTFHLLLMQAALN